MRYKITTSLVALLLLAFGCQSPEQVATTDNQETENEVKTALSHPDWYSPGTSFSVESSLFVGYASSANGDSLRSHQMAQKKAKANLEAGLSAYFEDRRKEFLESNPGSQSVDDNEFKFTLRNLSEKISSEAEIAEAHVVNKDNRYVGFCKTQISSQKVKEILQNTFANQTEYLSIVESWN